MIKLFDTTERFLRKNKQLVCRISQLQPEFENLSDEALVAKTNEFKSRHNNGEALDALLPEAFALVKEAAYRTLHMRHFDVQLLGGIALFQGKIAEMKTGEGKTLVSTLPAYLEALSGKGCHIVTVNSYLVKRDAEWMGQIYRFLALNVGYITGDQDPKEKREAYEADITYGTNSEFGFDYLRDNMVRDIQHRSQGDLNFAIVDEVDSVLVDEARTPLIISGPSERSTDLYYTAVNAIRNLVVEEDFEIDEKTKSVTITEKGIVRLQAILSIENLYADSQIEMLRHLSQALRAKFCFKSEVDYIVKENEVIIVDEFTGRLLPGRRYSDGLHQAIEAKEGLKVKSENQTLATITFQNFFRMYKKLSGMTGTAKTEENEFREIYGLDVIAVPTNKPIARKDHPDIVYKTESIKYKKIVDEIAESYKTGQPVLVGTRSIEKSEKISSMLKRKGVPHQVLNAKHHEREAEIIKLAGERNAITIATNMAGRGVDIVLGNGVQDLGGLHVIGTERHESRRIDNQLRGRSGRQGDPGSTRFFLSLEDELLRIFGGDRITSIFNTLKLDEDMPLESGLLTKAIENAQKKVESYNYDIRKNLLQYDDVLNKQREIIYNERKRVLESEEVEEHVQDMLEQLAFGVANRAIPKENRLDTNVEDYRKGLYDLTTSKPDLPDLETIKDLPGYTANIVKELYAKKEEEVGSDNMRSLERQILLYIVDSKWKDHLYSMDQLKEGIGLRGYGQEDPLVRYQIEGFKIFEDMLNSIKEEVVKLIFRIQVQKRPVIINKNTQDQKRLKETRELEKADKNVPKPERARKIGRNDLCPCGSGLKYKKCCGRRN
ncbi:MAG: preprotein translocase subunit SecA [Caldisericia bacterium]|nr:preprotein translocase subunit SecA [Caldisericia bacterium]MDD4614833.1 preprotein translocase subunit SecA [Caldisericia bacterium]